MSRAWTVRRQSRVAAAAAVSMALVACSAGEDADPAPTSGPTEEQATGEYDIPDSAVGRQVQWVLDQLAADSGPDDAEAEERFAPVFLEQVPAAQVSAVFDQLRAEGPFTLASYSEQGTGAQAELTAADDSRMALNVSVDDDERIQGLFLRPLSAVPDITDPAAAAAAVEEAAERSAFLLAEVDDAGTCAPVETHGEGELLPIGSVFKLYVLGAVVQDVADGELTWDDPLTLTEEIKSLPSGTLQEEPVGTQVSVQEAATAMIEISDNTATDLLIEAVGREAVEDVLDEMGHSAPQVNTPFLTTREMFQLALGDPSLREEWAAATGDDPMSTDPAVSERQRELIENLPPWDREVHPERTPAPVWPEGLDWFATTEDLCAAHVALQDLAGTEAGQPVREILSRNPGLTGAADGLDYVGFKGGSAEGEIAGAWYTETADGRCHVLVVQLADDADPAGVPDPGWLFEVGTQTLTGLPEG